MYRLGQTKNVFVHRFLVENTIEAKLVEIQKQKKLLSDNLLIAPCLSKDDKNLGEKNKKKFEELVKQLWNLL